MLCSPLKGLAVVAFLGDLRNKADIVSFHNSLSPAVQSFWTADAHTSYILQSEPWLLSACPGLSNHSYSTYFEALTYTNVTFRSRYLRLGPF